MEYKDLFYKISHIVTVRYLYHKKFGVGLLGSVTSAFLMGRGMRINKIKTSVFSVVFKVISI